MWYWRIYFSKVCIISSFLHQNILRVVYIKASRQQNINVIFGIFALNLKLRD